MRSCQAAVETDDAGKGGPAACEFECGTSTEAVSDGRNASRIHLWMPEQRFMRGADSRPEQRNVCTKLASPLHAFFTARGLPGGAEHVYGEGEIAELGQPLSTCFDELTDSPRFMY